MLQVTEIFKSIQGESTFAGMLFHFIRLTGCNLRCTYCDTKYAYEGGREMSVEGIIEQVCCDSIKNVLITGGEPLLQKETAKLAAGLIDRGYTVLVETNGSLDISILPEGAIRIMDLKCPSSGHEKDNLWQNLAHLTRQDEVKFVISDRRDYDWAKAVIDREKLAARCTLLFSPIFGILNPAILAGWMLEDQSPARLQLQLHKVIRPNSDRGF